MAIPLGAAVILLCLSVAVRPHRDVLDLSSSQLAVRSALFLSLFLLALSSTAGVLLLRIALQKQSWPGGLAALSYLVPAALLLAHAARDRLPAARRLEQLRLPPGDPTAIQLRQLVDRLGITVEVEALSPASCSSPELRPGWRKARLFLPASFTEDLTDIADSDDEGRALSKYILLHELAHVANRDSFIFSVCVDWLSLLLRYWLVPHVVFVFILPLFFGLEAIPPGTFSVGRATLLVVLHGLPPCVVLAILVHGIREREYLADARALLHLSKRESRLLFRHNKEPTPVLSKALLYYGLRQAFRRPHGWRQRRSPAGHGLAPSATFRGLLGGRIAVHPSPGLRHEAAREESRILPSYEGLRPRQAVLYGAAAGLVAFYGWVGPAAVAQHLQGGTDDYFVEAGMTAFFLALVFLFSVHMLPIRSTWTATVDTGRAIKGIVRTTLLATPTIIAVLLIPPLLSYLSGRSDQPGELQTFLGSAAALGFSIGYASGLFAVLAALVFSTTTTALSLYDIGSRGLVKRFVTVGLSIFVVGIGALLWFLHWQKALAAAVVSAVTLRGLQRFVSAGAEEFPNRAQIVWFGGRFLRLDEPSQIRWVWGIAWLAFPLILVATSVPARLLPVIPDARVALVLLLLCALLGFALMAWIGRTERARIEGRGDLRLLYWLGRMGRRSSLTKLSAELKERLRRVTSSLRSGPGLNPEGPGSGLPLLGATARGLQTTCWLSDERASRDALDWLLSCENESGGFGPWPGGASRVRLTFDALSYLDATGEEPRFANRHAAWLWSLQRADGRFREYPRDRANLEVDAIAGASLDLLGEADGGRLAPTAAAGLAEWRRGKKDFLATHSVVTLLNIAGRLDDETKSEFIEGWLKPMRPAVLALRPTLGIEETARYLEVAELLGCSQNPGLRQVRSRVSQSIDRALQKKWTT